MDLVDNWWPREAGALRWRCRLAGQQKIAGKVYCRLAAHLKGYYEDYVQRDAYANSCYLSRTIAENDYHSFISV